MKKPLPKPAELPRKRGRPRDPNVDTAVHDATLDLLAEGGYAKVTIEAVASRAGLVRPTIYRRYGTRAKLVSAAIRAALATATPTVPNTGDVEADLVTLLSQLARHIAKTRLGRAMQGYVSQLAHDPELAACMFEVQAERRALFRVVFDRARAEHRMRESLDDDTAYDLLAGVLYFRAWFTEKQKLSASLIATAVRLVLHPAQAPASS